MINLFSPPPVAGSSTLLALVKGVYIFSLEVYQNGALIDKKIGIVSFDGKGNSSNFTAGDASPFVSDGRGTDYQVYGDSTGAAPTQMGQIWIKSHLLTGSVMLPNTVLFVGNADFSYLELSSLDSGGVKAVGFAEKIG